jgi:hypothetical protein
MRKPKILDWTPLCKTMLPMLSKNKKYLLAIGSDRGSLMHVIKYVNTVEGGAWCIKNGRGNKVITMLNLNMNLFVTELPKEHVFYQYTSNTYLLSNNERESSGISYMAQRGIAYVKEGDDFYVTEASGPNYVNNSLELRSLSKLEFCIIIQNDKFFE